MEVEFVDDEALITFPWPPPPEKDQIKRLGAKWEPVGKVWRVGLTSPVIHWFESQGVDLPRDLVTFRDESLAASRATGADVVIPAPDGLDYRPFQKAGIAFALDRPGTLIGDEMGLGKSEPVSEPVLTPSGWRAIGDLLVGDMVIGADGHPTRVLGVYPQTDRRVVRITMSDGTWTRCSWDHLWRVQPVTSSGADWSTLTTAEIMTAGVVGSRSEGRWRIPMVKPVQHPRATHPIEPYLLGVVLGGGGWIKYDGSFFLLAKSKIVKAINVRGRVSDYCPDGMRSLETRELADELIRLGLRGLWPEETFIPDEYLVGSVDERHALLQGLLDTGGKAAHGKAWGGRIWDDEIVEFEASSARLLDGVSQIVESLGGTAEIEEGHQGRQYLIIMLPEGLAPFRLSSERRKYAASTKYPPTRVISSITPEPDEDSVCIRVEASDHLYVTRHHIVTHNTIQALGVVNADASTRSILIVCPLSVALNWKSEAGLWLTREMSIGVASGKIFPDTDIVIAHWGIVSKHSEELREREWDLVVLDEAHYAKNPKAGRTRAIMGDKQKGLGPVETRRRIALSGTPIPNRPIEIYPVLRWLAPTEFGNWLEFVTRYCGGYKGQFGWDVSGASNLGEFQERLRSAVMIRRLKKDVLTELPEKTRQVILVGADTPDLRKVLESEQEAQRKSAEALARAKAAVEVAKAGSDDEYKTAVAKMREAQGVAFTEMSRARHKTALAKIPQTLEHVKDVLADEGQKIVLFAHHRDVIDSLREGLETKSGEWPGVKTVSIMGGDSAEDRQEAVRSFQNDHSVRVFLGSIGAAREGITLTAADLAIFAEIDWVPGNLSQAEDRCMAEGSLVLTPGGWTPIEKINVGDHVITHTGAARRISDVWSKSSRQEMAEVLVTGWPSALVSTSDHKYLLEDGEWREAGDLRPGDWLALPANDVQDNLDNIPFEEPRTARVFEGSWGQQRNGRLVSAPAGISVTDDFLFTVGYYIGDGFASVARDKGAFVSLAGHRVKKAAALDRCTEWFSGQGVECSVTRRGSEFGEERRFYSRDWATWFAAKCGRVCSEKHVPAFALRMNVRQSRAVLAGLAASDGYDRFGNGRVQYVTTAETLAAQVVILAQRSGYRPTLTTGSTNQFVVGFGGPLGLRSGGRVTSVLLRHPRKCGGVRERVYDLTVDTDESFMVGHTIVHNCHRLGQRNAVTIQHVLLDHSLDATMIKTIIGKQEVLDAALDTRYESDGKRELPDEVYEPDHGLPDDTYNEVSYGSDIDEPHGKAATRDTTREQIAVRAEWIVDEEIELVHAGLREVSGMDSDYARELNGVGFARIDVAIGHDLAGRPYLSPKQAALGAKLLSKYHRQVSQEAAGLWRVLGERSAKSEAHEGQSQKHASDDSDEDKGDDFDSHTNSPQEYRSGLRL